MWVRKGRRSPQRKAYFDKEGGWKVGAARIYIGQEVQ